MNAIKARLCLGDGFIFVIEDPLIAAHFAAHLAGLITLTVAKKLVPVSFHFRMGVHYGPVFHFWDEGRNDWNYVGDGINGGNRVLSVIDKTHDDVVYISDAIRDYFYAHSDTSAYYSSVLSNLTTRGRREDKHKNMWRVFELDHMNAFQCPGVLL